MGEIIGFPDRPNSAGASAYDQDVVHVYEAIKSALPREVLNEILETDLMLAAARAIARLDEVRAIRHVAQERAQAAARAACEAAAAGEDAPANPGRGEYKALSDLFGGRPPSDESPGPVVA
ncbi:hypothetical protein FV232_19820 [Methylobacterium sp. WL30]|uniref:hypothetical protein n=1 Tax=unclassified Methylobacterium TaxID=2615210 RepID=UPI0011CA5BB7|nr:MULTISPECIES: hypothetical protein [unclassified Methylobacterium]TXN41405.1 hypothetical protein FV225_02645 [Methylobacterium sp. WL93]TXN49787.1 hypothetical protein FV227_14935 [Methylobacterium sp. WL119]TXN64874.1 hypothetical protein FV232_19820 [Methylobacterium sp. WL30]